MEIRAEYIDLKIEAVRVLVFPGAPEGIMAIRSNKRGVNLVLKNNVLCTKVLWYELRIVASYALDTYMSANS